MKPAGWARIALAFAAVISGIAVLSSSRVSAADGSGTNTVEPAEVTQSSTGNVLTFTFTAAEVMDSGGIRISVPSGGWSVPQGVAGTAGYTTASSSGTIGTVKNNLNSATGWAFARHMTLSADSLDKQEGSASLSNAITSSAVANEQWYFNYGAASDWGEVFSDNLRVGMWLKSSVAAVSGDFSWQDDDSANLGSPLDTIAIPALSANTWEYKSVTLGSTARNSISSYGFRYTTDIGAATLKADAISAIFSANDSNTGWTGDSGISDTALTTSGNFIEGTGAVRCTYAESAGTGDSGDCYGTGGTITVGPGTTVSFWVRSSVNLSAGDFAWVDDNHAGINSADSVVNLPALTANSWTYVTLTSPTSGDLRSFGLRQLVDKGAMTIDIDAIGKVVSTADSTTGWSVPADVQAVSADSVVFQEGTASLKNVITGSASSGEKWYETLVGAENWSGYTTVGFWIRSSVATVSGDLKFEYAGDSNLTSPIGSINIGALPANTWTFQKLTLTGTRTSVLSYGINYATDIGAATIYLDDVLLGPGVPTFSGNDINVRFLSLPSSGTVSVLYGSGGGSSGVTAPSTFGTYTFTTQSRSSDAGNLSNIASSPSVEVVSASAVKFVIDNPTDGTVDAPITVTVRALRSNNSLATNYQSDVTLVASGSATGEGLVDIVNGVGTIQISNTVAETVTLTLSDTQGTGLDVSSTQDVIFAAGALAKFTLNDPGDITAGTRAGYIVTRRDQHNNPVVGGTTTVYLYSTSTGGNKAFYDAASGGNVITSVAIGPGSSSANFWYYDDKSGTWTITGSDNGSAPDGTAGVDDATDTITINPGATTAFSLNDPGDITAGNRAGYVVTRTDTFGNPVTAGPQTVYLYSTSTGGNKAFYDAASGGNVITSVVISGGSSSANFWYYDDLVGAWTISGSDNATAPDGTTGIDDATDSIAVNAAALSKFTLNDPGDITAGTRAGYTITRTDAFNNPISSGTTTVYLYSTSTGGNKAFYDAASGGNVITSVAIGPGSSSANFWYYDDKSGTWTITGSDNGSAPDGTAGVDDATDSIIINPAGVASFALNDPGDIAAGSRAGYTVTRYDSFNNSVTSGSNTVYLYSNSTGPYAFYNASSGGSVITSVTISGGSSSANFWYYDEAAGTWDVTGSDNATAPDGAAGIDDATDSITVSVAATRFIIIDPTDGTVDAPITVTVRAENNNGALDTGYQSDVTLVASGSATGEGLVDIVNGVGTLQLSDTVAETVTLTLSDTQSTGLNVSSTQDVVFAPGATTAFTLNDPGDITAGTRAGYVVTKKDQFGNTTPSGSVTAYFYSTSTGSHAFYDAASGGNVIASIIIGSGSSSANFWYYDEKAGTWTITASDNATAPDGTTGIDDATDAIAVSAAAVSQFTLNDPGDITAGTRAGYTVTRTDTFGNPVTAGPQTVYLYSSSTGSNKAFYDASSGGNIITSVVISGGSSSANFWYYDELVGNWTITASDNATAPDGTTGIDDATDSIVVSPDTVSQFTLNDPGDINAGDRAGYTVTRKDQFGNPVTSGSNTVYLYSSSTGTFAFYDAASGGNVITSVVISGGSSSANFWYYDDLAGTWTITASDNATAPDGATGIDDATDSITVTQQAATKFVIVDPTDGTVDDPITVTVRAENDSGVVDASYQSDVTLVASGSAAGDGLVDIVNGVGTLQITDTVAETVILTLSDTQSTGLDVSSTQDVVFAPGATASFALNDPGDITAGTRAGYTVTKKDQFGNTTPSGSVTGYLYSSSTGAYAFYDAAVGGAQISFIAIGSGSSSANFWYYDELAGNWTITGSDNSVAPDGTTGIDDATDAIAINSAAASQFILNDPGDIVAGTRAGYTVTRKDAFNNLVISGSTTVYLYSSSTGPKSFYDAPSDGAVITSVIIPDASSSANFWYYDERAGTWSVTASDNATAPDGVAGIDDFADTITVSAAATGKFVLNNPGDMSANTRLGYMVSREDSFGNVATSGTDTVYLYSSSGGPYAFYNAAADGNQITSVVISDAASSANFWYYDEAVGNWTITGSDNATAPDGTTGIDDGTDPVSVSSAPIVATRFTIVEPVDATAGDSVTITVRAEDNSGNIDASYQSDVTLVASGSATGDGLVDIVNGVGTLQITDTVAETVILTLSDTQSTGLDVSSTKDVVFSVGPTAALFLNDPGGAAAGDRAGYTVTRKDQFGNLVTSGAGTFYLYSTSTGTNAFYDAASGGTAITSVVFLDGSSSASFWYADEKVGDWIVTVSDNVSAPDGVTGVDDVEDIIQITPGPVSRFSLNDPGDMTSGTRLGYTVSREDAFGNLVSSGSTTVYLYSDSSGPKFFYDSATGGSAITNVVIGSGSFSANFWYYDESAGTKTVIASDNASAPDGLAGIDDATDSVVVISGAIVATRFTILEPADARVGEAVTVTIRAEDDSGNVDTTYQSDVTLVASGSATGEGLVDIVNGVGTIQISNGVAETVILTLSDTEGTGLNASSLRDIIFSVLPSLRLAVPPPPPALATARFSGHTFPGARIVATALGDGIAARQERTALPDGSFDISIAGFPPGSRSFALVAYDKEGGSSQRRVFTLTVPTGETVSVSDISFPPTIRLARVSVTKGDNLLVTGYAVPGGTIEPLIDGEFFREAYAVVDPTGVYRLLIGTISLDFGNHSISVRETGVGTTVPLVSVTRTFSVSKLFTPKTDLNRDDKIDISDWSIFISKWTSTGDPARAEELDFNGDGKVDIADFSIFVRTIKR